MKGPNGKGPAGRRRPKRPRRSLNRSFPKSQPTNPAMAAPDAANISVSGAALAALLGCCGVAAGDCDGLLFGRAARPPALPPSLSDDDPAPASSAPSLSISITGHTSLVRPCSLSNPLGLFQPYSPDPSAAVGFFSSRRGAALRPSMREVAVACSLSKTLAFTHPIVFLLVCPSFTSNLSVHSFDYRAFLLVDSRLIPASLQVINVGPGFRDQYHTFAAESPMPWLPASAAEGYSIGQQKAMDRMVEGFGLGRVEAVVVSATGQANEMEEMYAGMLRRLEGLAREVEESNERVLDQVVVRF